MGEWRCNQIQQILCYPNWLIAVYQEETLNYEPSLVINREGGGKGLKAGDRGEETFKHNTQTS